jgi:intraflagellar transport protein 81
MRTLEILKFRFPSEDLDRYRASLRKGERAVVYPILYWALSNFRAHAKRAYLSRFLLKLEIPQDYLQDEALAHAAQQLGTLQNEFIAAHRQVDELRKNQLAPQELRGEITQVNRPLSLSKKSFGILACLLPSCLPVSSFLPACLPSFLPSSFSFLLFLSFTQLEQEKNQLEDKIQRMKDKTSNEPGFEDLLNVTSTLRKEQVPLLSFPIPVPSFLFQFLPSYAFVVPSSSFLPIPVSSLLLQFLLSFNFVYPPLLPSISKLPSHSRARAPSLTTFVLPLLLSFLP